MFANLKLSTKLLGQLVVQLSLLILCGVAGITGLKSVFVTQVDITNKLVPSMNYLRAASVDIHQALLAERVLCTAESDSEEFKNQLKDYKKNMGQAKDRYQKFLDLNKDADLKDFIAAYEAAYKAWEPLSREIVENAVNGKNKQAALKKSLGLGFDKFDTMESSLDEIADTVMEKIINKTKYSGNKFQTTKTILYSIIIISIFGGLLVSYFLYHNIFKILGGEPQLMADIAQNIALGDLQSADGGSAENSVGLYSSMNVMCQNLQKTVQGISKGMQTLSSSSNKLSTVSDLITSNSNVTADKANTVAAAEEMSTNMNSVATATEQASSNIQTIVSAAEEMTSTIQEIANNMSKGSETTSQAVEKAQEVSIKVNDLGKAASEISDVTETIKDISEQTNLLALRAGEAGKGFAIVAGEIKALAQQTAEATSEINEKISGVQNTTAESVTVIESIVNVINDINMIVTTVATAIEEQSATTQEISNNVSQAGLGIQEVNENVNQISAVTGEVTQDISEVSQIAQDTNAGSKQVIESAAELTKLAEDLNKMIGQFKI
ncbi:MAG: hypothetical protein GY857_06455 [Desulfobacula sp.]|nr:hypothetical protein [Desulfobacula sp.]